MRGMALLLGWLFSCAVWGAPTVHNLKVTPIAPWGLALDYTVEGGGAVTNKPLVVTATDGAKIYAARNLVGATNWANGAHRVYWNMAKDGMTATVTNSTVTVGCPSDYLVVDLSAGTDAAAYPVSFLDATPAGGWTDEHKTTKLVLRRVEAGSFIMGDNSSNESHRVTLTKPFYVGVFEVTQKQWELVMGNNPSPSKGDMRPVGCVSYDMVRGSSEGTNAPSSSKVDTTSFLGRLRARTGLDCFDLPTEAQWEYVCRAGSNTAYCCGKEADDAYMWCNDANISSASHDVGTKKPNAWGLYDMHGNAWEWCRDWYRDLSREDDPSYKDAPPYGNDPCGPRSGSCRVLRGGSWWREDTYASAAYRFYDPPSKGDTDYGFRLALTDVGTSAHLVGSMAGCTVVTNWSSIADGSWIKDGVLTVGLAPRTSAAACLVLDGSNIVNATAARTATISLSTGAHVLQHAAADTVTNPDAHPVLSANYFSSLDAVTDVSVGLTNGLVEITYDVVTNLWTFSAATNWGTWIFMTDGVTGASHWAHTFSGEPVVAKGEGDRERHVLYWDAAADGVTLKSSVSFSVSVATGFNLSAPYCVVDLSAGPAATAYPVFFLDAAPAGGWTNEHKTRKLVLRRVEAGSFIMGDDQANETHRVTLTKPFYMGVFEVTQEQWELVMGDNPSFYKSKGAALPVEQVSWTDVRGDSGQYDGRISSAVAAASFLGKLRAKTGLDGLDLLTEAQWEYACRAGTTTKYCCGDAVDGAYMWYVGNQSDPRQPHAVGTKKPNAWGLYDMHGNVWEWCLDTYGGLAYGIDPKGVSSAAFRVWRGGTWESEAADVASSARNNAMPTLRSTICGVRLAMCFSDEAPPSCAEIVSEAFSGLVVPSVDPSTWPSIKGDTNAVVRVDEKAGYIVTPSADNKWVEVTIPVGTAASNVTVEVGADVVWIQSNGAAVKVMRNGHDITAYLDIPEAYNGEINLASATVKPEYATEPLDVTKGAKIDLSSPARPSLTTVPTRPGLVYTLREGRMLRGMVDGDSTIGDGAAWTPRITVKGAPRGFYSIRVDK